MKKLAMILMCVALVFTCVLPAVAEDDPAYSIRVENPIKSEVYTAYKIFDVTASGNNFSYVTSPSSEWWSILTTPSDNHPISAVNASGQTVSLTATEFAEQINSLKSFTIDKLTYEKTAMTDANSRPIYNVTHQDTGANRFSDEDAAKLAAKLYPHISGKTAAGSAQASSSDPATAIIPVSGNGYYFVTTSTGALCALKTNSPSGSVTVREKNDVPTLDKKVSDSGLQNTWGETADAAFGDTVYFKVTVTDGKGTDQPMVITDTMNNGLTLNMVDATVNNETVSVPDITVSIVGTDVNVTYAPGQEGEHFTVTPAANGKSFVINFPANFVKNVPDNAEIIINYTATVGNDAYIRGNTQGAEGAEAFNQNTVTLEYSHQTDTRTVTVYTYKFQVVKTTSDRYDKLYLEGATFKLYDANNQEIPVVLVPTEAGEDSRLKKYRKATAAEIANDQAVLIEAGLAEIVGVDTAVYHLEEIEAPSGYNKLSTPVDISVTSSNYSTQIVQFAQDNVTYSAGGTRIVNMTGAEMPSTGGIGTYLFYGIGALLVIGAVVVLISKKRMHAIEE